MKAKFFDSVGQDIPTIIIEAETPEESMILRLICSAKLTFTGENASRGETELAQMGFWPTVKKVHANFGDKKPS